MDKNITKNMMKEISENLLKRESLESILINVKLFL